MTEPETEHIENNLVNAVHPALSYFCRKLERERDEARATCSELVTDSDAITLARTVVHITQERDEAREQRDRLAEALQRVRDGYGGQAVDPACGCDDCAYLRPIDAALQYLTPNKP